jgi:hypothetical protein
METNSTDKSRLNSRQRRFLRMMSDEVLTPEELLAKCRITGHDFHTWMKRKAFRRELALTMRTMGKRCDVDLAVGAKVGSQTLTNQAKYGADGNQKRLASVNLIGLNIQRRRINRRAGKRRATEPDGPAMQELPPDLSLEESERLLRIIEADGKPPEATTEATTDATTDATTEATTEATTDATPA